MLTRISHPGLWIGLMVLFAICAVVGAGVASTNSAGQAGKETLSRQVTAAEEDTLDQAEQVLMSWCMRQQGFTFVPHRVRSAADRSFPYVLDDVDWAAQYGYGSSVGLAKVEAMRADPNGRYFQALPPDQQRAALTALNGERPVGLIAHVPGGGTIEASDHSCRADAQRQLYGDLPAWFQARAVVSNLPGLYVDAVEQDPRFTAALAGWAQCMRAAGHPYQSPDQIREELDQRARGPVSANAHTLEVELAVAEATCARRTGLAAIAAELDRYYGDQVRAQYQSEIETKRRLQLAALPRAQAARAAWASSQAALDASGVR